jgi:hypothetical protein
MKKTITDSFKDMVFQKVLILLPLLVALGAVVFAMIPDEETVKVMPFVSSKSYCKQCHSEKEVAAITDPARACNTYCLTCHDVMVERHHPIGMRFKKVPPGIIMTKNQRLACISCHDLDTRRFDSVPWKSESLFGSVFNIKARYETYYLVKRNNDGALCFTCHSGRMDR